VRSRLYSGHVVHKRSKVAENHFRYPIYYVGVDLDELDELDKTLKHFGHNRRARMSVYDADHGARDGSPLKPWIEDVVRRAGITEPVGRVMLLTFPRVLGFKFWPVSFWYIYSVDDTPLAVMAEVQNTFRDHHDYLLHNGGEPFDWHALPESTKAFYVSPFIRVEDMRYRFHFSEPGEHLSATIYDHETAEGVLGDLVLTASIALDAEPLTDAAIRSAVRRLGPISARALILIHWQALKLFFKRVPFFAHTPPPAEEISLDPQREQKP